MVLKPMRTIVDIDNPYASNTYQLNTFMSVYQSLACLYRLLLVLRLSTL